MSHGASCGQPAVAKRSILPGCGSEREMQKGEVRRHPATAFGVESSHCPLGPNKHLAFVRAWGGSGCSSPRLEPDWQVCLCEPSRPRLPGAPCWTLATGHWPAGSWCRPARVSHIAPRHRSDFLLPGPPPGNSPRQTGSPDPARRPGGLAGRTQGSGERRSPRSASPTRTSRSDRRSLHLGEPRTRVPRLLPTNTHSTSSSTKTHLRSMSRPPRDARDPRLSQLSRRVPTAPGSHGRGDCPSQGKGWA